MEKIEIEKFLDKSENQEALRLLAQKITDLDTVLGEYPKRDRERMIEFSARRLAIETITAWLDELWGVKRGDWDKFYTQEKNEFIRIKEENK